MTHKKIDFEAIWAEQNAARERSLAENRPKLRAGLQAKGGTSIWASYDACGDSGNIDDVTLLPGQIALDCKDNTALWDFLWTMVYHLHPGFEIEDGAFGEITWDLVDDKITIDHNERFTDYERHLHEGL